MANKHTKVCSKLLAVWEIQMKISRKYHCTPIRITTIKNTDNTEYQQGCRATETLITGWNANWYSHFENSLTFLK